MRFLYKNVINLSKDKFMEMNTTTSVQLMGHSHERKLANSTPEPKSTALSLKSSLLCNH